MYDVILFSVHFFFVRRGVNAGEISGPGYCLHPPPKRRVMNNTFGCKGGVCNQSHNVLLEQIQVHVKQTGGAECGNVSAVHSTKC